MMDGPVTVEPPGPVDLSDDIDLTDELELEDLDALGELEAAPVVDVDQVRRFLAGAGSAAAFALADPDVPEHWRFTDAELDDIAPAITAIANRRPQLARAIESSDYLVLGVHLARYAGRNVQAGRAARNAREETDGLNGQARPNGGFGLAATAPSTDN
jgi:hypothetical protein